MKKTRLLDVDYGYDPLGGHYYWPSSSMISYVESAYLDRFAWDKQSTLLARRGVGAKLAANPIEYPANVGSEIFISSEKPRPLFNNCDHGIVKACNFAITVSYEKKGKAYLLPYWRYQDYPDINDVNALGRHFSADASNAQRTAWGTMQPRFEGDVNLFVFLAELKDFRQIAKFMVRKPLRKLSNYFRKLGNKLKKMRINTRTPWDASLPLAQAHLTNEFALKPLLADIYSMSCQMEVLAAEAQQKFADAGRELSSRHYTEELYREDFDTRDVYSQTLNPQLLVGRSKILTFNATMEHSYRYNTRSSLDAFMRYWGLVPNAEAIWELIPFSFLVDYFVKIGQSIKVASRDRCVDLNLSQYCESLESIESVGTHFKKDHLICPSILIGDPMGDKPVGRIPSTLLVSGVYSSLYTRRVCQPNRGLALPRIARPSTKQGLNMLALTRCFL